MFELEQSTIFANQEIKLDGDVSLTYRSPITVTVNKFNEESAHQFKKDMVKAQNSGQKIIPIEIDSYGGEVYSLLKMIDVIKASSVPVATICIGKAMSCGAILLTFGAEGHRYMAPSSTVMIHDVSSGSWGKVEDIKTDAKEVDRLNQFVYRMMANNCGKDSEYFLKIVHEKSHADWYLDAEEAKKHNVANHLRVPKMKLKFNVDATFG
jgi:ATP-dependent Clp protease protease subunit